MAAPDTKYRRMYGKVIKDHNLPICSCFGCSRVLTLPEQLAGSKCTGCMNIKPINVNLIIKYK